VVETFVRTFTGNWEGTGLILSSGDTEAIALDSGQDRTSEARNIGNGNCYISTDKYLSGAGAQTIQYKTGSTRELCEADDWNNYTGPFNSEGWVQVKVNVA